MYFLDKEYNEKEKYRKSVTTEDYPQNTKESWWTIKKRIAGVYICQVFFFEELKKQYGIHLFMTPLIPVVFMKLNW